MTKIRKSPTSEKGYQYIFVCPGCNEEHAFNDVKWRFNNDYEKPTISPSYLLTYLHSSKERNKVSKDYHKKHGRWLTQKELPHDLKDICHSFIKNGMIQYLGDCTHKLAGQTVELPDIETTKTSKPSNN